MPFMDIIQPDLDNPRLAYEERLIEYVSNIEQLQTIQSHPSNPGWDATVYFDPAKYPDDFAQERVRSYYARNYRGREFSFVNLRASDLEWESPFLTSTAEKGFLNRGFYADIETPNHARGEGYDVLVQGQLMRSACGHQLAKIAAFYAGRSEAKIVWESALGRLMGEFVVPVPLVKEDFTYWPRREFLEPSGLHFAYTGKVDTTLKDGVADKFGLTRATDQDVAVQVAFEKAHCMDFFNGASRESLFLWQTQILAMLRKSTWNSMLSSDGKFRKYMTKFATQRRQF